MKLLFTLLTGLTLSASLPAFAETHQTIQPSASVNTTSNSPVAHQPHYWHHGYYWHRRYYCGPLGLFRCWDVNADVEQSVDGE